MNVTFDNNGLIDLEQHRPNEPFLKKIISDARLTLRVAGITASEKNKYGTYPKSAEEFRERLRSLELTRIEILKPIAYWGISYWNWAVYASDEQKRLEEDIHRIMFPKTEFRYEEFCKAKGLDPTLPGTDKNWRNKKCDVLTTWCHINYGGGLLVTRDADYLSKVEELKLLTPNYLEIQNPEDACKTLDV